MDFQETTDSSLMTPVAFFIFKRPGLTRRVFERIRAARPEKLLVIADGPRHGEEAALCDATRAIIQDVDWPCQVLTHFSENNMGCRNRLASGLNWVFEQVEEAIILEDDCLPAPSFFNFCQTLLARYRHDERVAHIGGNNFQAGRSRTQASYYFSRYSHIWGWATWRRAWRHYDVNMATWPAAKAEGLLSCVFENPDEQAFWFQGFEKSFLGQIQSWDYQWFYTCLSRGGLAILPDVNMITNIGFGEDSTHTHQETDSSGIPSHDIWEIKHPTFVVRHFEADHYIYPRIYAPGSQTPSSQPAGKGWLQKVLGRKGE